MHLSTGGCPRNLATQQNQHRSLPAGEELVRGISSGFTATLDRRPDPEE